MKHTVSSCKEKHFGFVTCLRDYYKEIILYLTTSFHKLDLGHIFLLFFKQLALFAFSTVTVGD